MGELGERFAKQEFQYNTVLDLGKFMYDAYIKLATMTFTMNGLLLYVVWYLLPHAPSPQANAAPDQLYRFGVPSASLIGLIYNLGAFFTYLAISVYLRNLFNQFEHLDHELGLNVNSARTRFGNAFGYVASALTFIFFCFWLVVWATIFNFTRGR